MGRALKFLEAELEEIDAQIRRLKIQKFNIELEITYWKGKELTPVAEKESPGNNEVCVDPKRHDCSLHPCRNCPA